MACVLGGDGNEYCDGTYTGFCSREKAQREFSGVVSLTSTGRILATGPCGVCRTLITAAVYSPPV